MPKKQLLFFLFALPLPWRRELQILQLYDWNKNGKNLQSLVFLSRYARYTQMYVKTIAFFQNSTYILVLALVGAATLWTYLNNFNHVYVCLESFEPYFFTLNSSRSSRVILDVPGYSTQQTKAAHNQNFFWPSVLKNKHIYIVIFSDFLFAKQVKHFFFVKKTTTKLNAAGI